MTGTDWVQQLLDGGHEPQPASRRIAGLADDHNVIDLDFDLRLAPLSKQDDNLLRPITTGWVMVVRTPDAPPLLSHNSGQACTTGPRARAPRRDLPDRAVAGVEADRLGVGMSSIPDGPIKPLRPLAAHRPRKTNSKNSR